MKADVQNEGGTDCPTNRESRIWNIMTLEMKEKQAETGVQGNSTAVCI